MEKKSNFSRFFTWLGSPFVKKLLVETLEKQAIKLILKKLVITGGLKGWLVSFVVGELMDETDDILIKPLFRKINFVADVINGRKVYREIDDAENSDDWFDTISRN